MEEYRRMRGTHILIGPIPHFPIIRIFGDLSPELPQEHRSRVTSIDFLTFQKQTSANICLYLSSQK